MGYCLSLNAEGNFMLLHFLIRLLETLFIAGMAGSFVVAIWAFVGDIHVLLDKDEEPIRTNAAS
jgi:hypothetical protein